MGINAIFVLVPEASTDLDDAFEPSEHQIGLTRQTGGMQSEAETHLVNQSAHCHLWLGAFASNLAHVLAAPSSGDGVYHDSPRSLSSQRHKISWN